jgi:tetratricopeptide (TPR) repeat protein
VRVTAELTEASTGRHVWSETYDAEAKNIFGVQDDVSRRMVGAAAAKLTRFERDRALAKPTGNLAAYEYVLRGREFTSHSTRESNDEAQDMFRRAIDLDPGYAAAYAELGLSLREAVASRWTGFVADDLGRAEGLAHKALSLDPSTTTAYRLLAEIDLARGRFDLALGQTEHVLEINPSDARASRRAGTSCYGRAKPQRLCLGSKERYASIVPMPEPPISSRSPITSLRDRARPSRQWIAGSPAASVAISSSWVGRFWPPPMRS